MNYTGKLYGKINRTYIPLIMTSDDVDKLERELSEARLLYNAAVIGGKLLGRDLDAAQKQRDSLADVLSEIIHEEGGTRGLATSNPICVKARQALATAKGGEG